MHRYCVPFFFIETLVGETRCPDRIGTEFVDLGAAVKTAFAALLDIAQNESELPGGVDVSICLKDFGGQLIFRGQLRTLRGGGSDRHTVFPPGDEWPHKTRLQLA